jgi:hypothetical protein
MIRDFKISDKLASRIIDFLYDIKHDTIGWSHTEAKNLIQLLEDEAVNGNNSRAS